MDERELAWVEGITRSGLDLNFFHAEQCILRLREVDAFSDAQALSDRAVFRIRCRCTDVLAVDLERMCVQLVPRTRVLELKQITEPAAADKITVTPAGVFPGEDPNIAASELSEDEVRALLQGATITELVEHLHPVEGDRLQLTLASGYSVQIAAQRLRLSAVKIA
jgi:hypothetical protein